MNFRYHIFPEKKLIVQRYAGAFSIQDFISCAERMWADPLYCKSYDGIADVTQISVRVSPLDVPILAKHLLGHHMASEGRWVALASTPVVTALAFLFQQTVLSTHRIEVFSTWDAACAFLGVEALLGMLPDF